MTGRAAAAPECDIDFYGAETLCDPAAAYRRMHGCGPVLWLSANRIHAVVGFAEVTASLRNAAVFQSGHGVSINEEVNRLLIGSTLNSDRPEHDATRAITFASLAPKALAEVRVRIEAAADEIVGRLTAKGEFDAARELAPHLPLTIVRDLVGLGDHGAAHMLDWGAATFELMGDPKDRREKAAADLKALRRFLEDPGTLDGLTEDGWARRATRRGLAEGMAPARAVELMRDYIAPSLDTTISAIGYAIMLFAQNPGQWDKLRADRGLIRNAIEEIIRLNTPIRAFTRRLAEPAELGGVGLRAGERVLIVYGAANRDPARFEDPDAFDIERDLRGHVGFGHGVHTCLGMHLARLEITCLINALVDKVRRFEICGPIEMAMNSTIHALARLPVRAEPL